MSASAAAVPAGIQSDVLNLRILAQGYPERLVRDLVHHRMDKKKPCGQDKSTSRILLFVCAGAAVLIAAQVLSGVSVGRALLEYASTVQDKDSSSQSGAVTAPVAMVRESHSQSAYHQGTQFPLNPLTVSDTPDINGTHVEKSVLRSPSPVVHIPKVAPPKSPPTSIANTKVVARVVAPIKPQPTPVVKSVPYQAATTVQSSQNQAIYKPEVNIVKASQPNVLPLPAAKAAGGGKRKVHQPLRQ